MNVGDLVHIAGYWPRLYQIDRLLDELSDYKRLAAEFGDEEYVNKVEEIKRRLTEVTAIERSDNVPQQSNRK